MIAVFDMGPLHYLVLIECEHILPHLFDRVITAGVIPRKEMADPATPEAVRRWAADPPKWLEVLEPKHIEDIPSLGVEGVRGDGDRAVISLAHEVRADFVVMDDMKARREAKKRGLEPLWMLEVLDEAAERGLINNLTGKLEHLEHRTSFYIGPKARLVIEGMKQRELERKQVHERKSLPETEIDSEFDM
jgi:predicted nucleic acid-binding protein